MRKVNIKSPGTFLGVLKLFLSGQLYGAKFDKLTK